MAKCIDTKVAEPEKSYHYFGSTCFNWAKGETAEEVLAKLAEATGAKTIAQNVKNNGGFYAWTCRVNVPASKYYLISFFQPQEVDISDTQEFHIMNSKGHCLPITRDPVAEVKSIEVAHV